MNVYPPSIVPGPPSDDELAEIGRLSATAQAILTLMRTGPAACRAVARVAGRGDAEDDRNHLVSCPGCGRRSPASESDTGEFKRWTNGSGRPFA